MPLAKSSLIRIICAPARFSSHARNDGIFALSPLHSEVASMNPPPVVAALPLSPLLTKASDNVAAFPLISCKPFTPFRARKRPRRSLLQHFTHSHHATGTPREDGEVEKSHTSG